ncbi:MAG: hypothetical protein ACRC5C_03730, partial [Bacilli bacterium]
MRQQPLDEPSAQQPAAYYQSQFADLPTLPIDKTTAVLPKNTFGPLFGDKAVLPQTTSIQKYLAYLETSGFESDATPLYFVPGFIQPGVPTSVTSLLYNDETSELAQVQSYEKKYGLPQSQLYGLPLTGPPGLPVYGTPPQLPPHKQYTIQQKKAHESEGKYMKGFSIGPKQATNGYQAFQPMHANHTPYNIHSQQPSFAQQPNANATFDPNMMSNQTVFNQQPNGNAAFYSNTQNIPSQQTTFAQQPNGDAAFHPNMQNTTPQHAAFTQQPNGNAAFHPNMQNMTPQHAAFTQQPNNNAAFHPNMQNTAATTTSTQAAVGKKRSL